MIAVGLSFFERTKKGQRPGVIDCLTKIEIESYLNLPGQIEKQPG
jgi:hypothetical protein